MEEQEGVCGDTPDTSPVHKRFRQGSPSPEILVTTANNTQTKCCEESKIDHHYDSNNRKSSESVESQVSSLSVEIAKCAEVGNDEVEITHSKVDQFNFTDDSDIFLSSTSYSSSRSKAQKHLISSANANKPRKIDVEDQCRLQELKENSKTDLGLSLRNPKPQHEMESLSEKVCSLESISNNEDLVDVANTFQTDSYPLTNDNGRDNISEVDIKPSLCLLDFCDSNHLATKQALPFTDSSVEKCGCPLTAPVVSQNHQTAELNSTKTCHLCNCKDAARACEEHVWKSEIPESHQHCGRSNTQIKSQPTLDSSPDHIEIKPTPDGHLCCEDSDIVKNQPTVGSCAGQSDIKPTLEDNLRCEDSDILKNQPTVGSCAGQSDIKPTLEDNLCCEDSDILKNQSTIGSCADQSDIKPTREDNLCCEDSDIVKNQSTIGSCADQSDGDVCCGDSNTRIKNQLPSDSIIDQNEDKHITEQKVSICSNGQHCGLTPTQGNNAIGKDPNETSAENTDDFTDKEKGVAEEGSVVYMFSDRYLQLCDAMVRVPGRACMVHRLIESYGLLRYVRVVPPCELVREDLLQFHTEDYLAILERLNTQGEDGYDEQSQLCGIGYDCPALPGVLDYASLVAGATVTAADFLLQGKCSVAINWFGGWHHAKKDEASGFCYINDIVLGILHLREKFQRVLYIDLDLHHGDGVEDAFAFTSKVFTLSFHKYGSGFFPGTGPISEVGVGKGRYFSLNVPLLDGIRDDHFYAIVSRLTEKVREVYRPQAVVCQCGADGLAGDPMDSFNLSHLGLGKSIHSLIQWKLPLLLLGGGGYNHANTARAWAFLTGVAVGKKLPPDIPDHQFFTAYGPTYELAVTTGNRKDLNTRDHLTRVFRQALGILQKTSQVLKDFKKDVRS